MRFRGERLRLEGSYSRSICFSRAQGRVHLIKRVAQDVRSFCSSGFLGERSVLARISYLETSAVSGSAKSAVVLLDGSKAGKKCDYGFFNVWRKETK